MASAESPAHPPQGRARNARVLLVIASGAVIASFAVTAAAAAAPSPWRSQAELAGMGALWVIAIGTVVVWRRYDSLAGIGLRRVGGRDVLIAFASGVVLMLAVPALAWLATTVTAHGVGLVESATARPAQLVVLGVLTAAVTEEVVFRGAAMGALARAGAVRFWQVAVPAVLFTATHVAWSPAHTLFVVLPLSVALGCLYLWRRSLPVTMLAHLIIDAPLVVFALAA